MDLPLITVPLAPAVLATITTGDGFAALLAGLVAGDAAPIPQPTMPTDQPSTAPMLPCGVAPMLPVGVEAEATPPDAEPGKVTTELLEVPTPPPDTAMLSAPMEVPPLAIAPRAAVPIVHPTPTAVEAAAPVDVSASALAPRAPATNAEAPAAASPQSDTTSSPALASPADPAPVVGETTASATNQAAEKKPAPAAAPSQPPIAMNIAPPIATPAHMAEPSEAVVVANLAAPAVAASHAAPRKPAVATPEAAPYPPPPVGENAPLKPAVAAPGSAPSLPPPIAENAPRDTPMAAPAHRAEPMPQPDTVPTLEPDATMPAAPRDPAPATQPPRNLPETTQSVPMAAATPPTPAAPAPSEAAPPPRPAPVAAPARQVAPFAVALSLGPDARLDLTLDPVELGRVEVAIERQGNEAVVSLRAERPETLALLQRDRADLERALSDAGLRNSDGGGPSLSFGLGGEGASRQDRRAPSQRHAIAPQGPEPVPQAIAPRGLIDLAL